MREYKSVCCDAPVKIEIGLPDFLWDKKSEVVTNAFTCTKCEDYCDVYVSFIGE